MIRNLISSKWYPAVIALSATGAILGCSYSAALAMAAVFLPSLHYVAGKLYSLYSSQIIEGGAA